VHAVEEFSRPVSMQVLAIAAFKFFLPGRGRGLTLERQGELGMLWGLGTSVQASSTSSLTLQRFACLPCSPRWALEERETTFGGVFLQ